MQKGWVGASPGRWESGEMGGRGNTGGGMGTYLGPGGPESPGWPGIPVIPLKKEEWEAAAFRFWTHAGWVLWQSAGHPLLPSMPVHS